MTALPEILITDDGSHTLRHPVLGDTYHSMRGAVGEARHVFIDGALGAWLDLHGGHVGPVNVLEIGLGSGLNAWFTQQYAEERGVSVDYYAVELYPVPKEVWGAMDYALHDDFAAIHESPWNEQVALSEHFRIKKIAGDLVACTFDATFDVVYMDAFAPDTVPEMWTEDIFRKLYNAIRPSGVMTTYCAKGEVRRIMAKVGFRVERRPGALGKRHMLAAVK